MIQYRKGGNMKRSVGVERTFSISNYNNLKPMEFLSEIPDELAMDSSFINKVRFIQLINLELTYRKYLVLKDKMDQESPEVAIANLEELKSNAMDELNQILNKEE